MFNFIKRIFGGDRLFGATRSSAWAKVRKVHLEKNGKCLVCGTDEELEVHHIIPVHIDSSLELEPKNLMTLCEKNGCHFAFGHFYYWRVYNPNVVVDCADMRAKVRQSRINKGEIDNNVIQL